MDVFESYSLILDDTIAIAISRVEAYVLVMPPFLLFDCYSQEIEEKRIRLLPKIVQERIADQKRLEEKVSVCVRRVYLLASLQLVQYP